MYNFRYLSLKACLLVPSTLDNAFLFGALTGSWMVQLALSEDCPRLTKLKELQFPLKDVLPPSFKYIPGKKTAIKRIKQAKL